MTTTSRETLSVSAQRRTELSLRLASALVEREEIMSTPHTDLGVNPYSSDECTHCTGFRQVSYTILQIEAGLGRRSETDDVLRSDLAGILHNDGTLGEVEIHPL